MPTRRQKHSAKAPARPGFIFVVFVTSLAFFVTQLDVTIVNVALPRMAQELSASVGALQWVVDAYTLAFAVTMLSAGALGDRLGVKRGFQLGIALFGTASLACALAPSALFLNLSRVLQGLGAAAMLPNSLALLNHAFAHDTRTGPKRWAGGRPLAQSHSRWVRSSGACCWRPWVGAGSSTSIFHSACSACCLPRVCPTEARSEAARELTSQASFARLPD
jgi:hypothetical protein